ncbi:HAMP domain-containing sensor histidine kinase [Streptosporangium oxazolinicum]|uniref:histidine kinase n=1 Tax=Streptosporangium oxazolinicum TaxID=909287 RepID=A0ABP8B5N7_9ACTN
MIAALRWCVRRPLFEGLGVDLHSIQARFTLAIATLAVVLFSVMSAIIDLGVRAHVEGDAFEMGEQVASQWSAVARTGRMPHLIPAAAPVDLVQLVGSNGEVMDASRQASRLPALSTHRPPPDDRFQRLSEYVGDRRVLLMAIRISPAPDAPVIYAGLRAPTVVASHGLEYAGVGTTLLLSLLAAWMTWSVTGRALRPVEAIRRQLSTITAGDLSLRLPTPAGRDEIALLARTANQTLTMLEEAMSKQRQFTSTTSHELRTPLAGLRVQLEEALTYPGDVDPQETIRTALATTDRLETIVNDLLLMARLHSGQPAVLEPIDLGALVTEEASPQTPGVPVRIRVLPGVWVHGSRIQLIRVLDNLLVNARRHARTLVEVVVEPVSGQAVVSVSDDGAGIAAADRERVFERFTRLADAQRRDPGGSGLGLAISRDIAHAHHGSLRVEDSSQGACFVLRLPLIPCS